MSALQAFIITATAGLLCGTIIEALLNVSIGEALFRILVLTATAGLMGALLVWLHQGLEASRVHDEANGS